VELNTTPHDDTQPVITIRDKPRGALRLAAGCALLIAGLSLACGMLAHTAAAWLRQTPVTVLLDGGTHDVQTRSQTVADLLRELDIRLNEGDVVTPGLTATLTPDTVVQVARSRGITLTVDGQQRLYRTHLTSPADILASAGVTVNGADQIIIDGTSARPDDLALWPVPARHITVRRAQPLHIIDGDSRITLETTRETVGSALFEAGITLYLADTLIPGPNTPVQAGMQVTIRRSQPVSIIADGVTIETRVTGQTVGDALAEAGLTLVGLDYSVPDIDVRLRPGVYIRIIRVREEMLIDEEVQPHQRIYQPDPTLELDQTRQMQAGHNGIIQSVMRVRYENDIEISRTLEERRVIQEPANEIVAYGTNIVLRTVDTPEGPRQYWRRIRMYATSYHPGSVGGSTRTAIGETLRKGIISGDPSIIPYRSHVYVPGYGIGMMADTGAMRRRLRIDLGYSDDDWVSWSRYVDVYLLTPVPDTIEYLLPRE
jgi:uncharacterized protein YabE (DUF348 family)